MRSPLRRRIRDSLDASGALARSVTFNGQRQTLASFTVPAGTTFDGVHLVCGILSVIAPSGGTSAVDVYVKGLVVTACKPP